MNGKDCAADTDIADTMHSALDDLERAKAILGGVTVVLDDMRCRVMARYEDRTPGPWDDDHPDNRRD